MIAFLKRILIALVVTTGAYGWGAISSGALHWIVWDRYDRKLVGFLICITWAIWALREIVGPHKPHTNESVSD